MINKEIIYRNGGIERDFINKQIPQYSHMQVNVNCLIPAALLQGLPNYAVMLAMEFKADDSEEYEQRPSLVMFTGKTLNIDGIDYIKFMALLPISYTDKVGRLKLTPYIQTTTEIEVEVDGTLVPRTITAIQQTFTEGYLIVVKASKDTGDTSVEDPEQITALLALINSKRIFYVDEYREAAYGALLWHVWNDYNPALTIYKGAIIIAKYDKFQDTLDGPYKKKTNLYFDCQVTTGENSEDYILMLDVETREMTKYYNIERTGTEGAYNYSYQEEKVTYNKAAIDALIQDLWNAKVDKTTTINNKPLSSDITLVKKDVGLEHVEDYGVETQPSASGENLYITSKGVWDALQSIYSLLSSDYATKTTTDSLDARLDSVEAIIGSDNGDSDSVINTLKEVIVVLNGLGEDANILSLINAKANQSDLNALNNEINGTNGIKDKVDILSENNNAYMEIKNSVGTIDILVADWTDNTGDTKYPYKYELINGYLEGAVNCIVVYSKDSDTSMLSATTGIDDLNGKLIIYASELPAETISIEKIAVFNDLNAYINYSNEIVQQVLANTSAISDINNTKLPQYLKGVVVDDDYQSTISHNGQEIEETIEDSESGMTYTQKADTSEFYIEYYTGANNGYMLHYSNLGVFTLGGRTNTWTYTTLSEEETKFLNKGTGYENLFDMNGDILLRADYGGGIEYSYIKLDKTNRKFLIYNMYKDPNNLIYPNQLEFSADGTFKITTQKVVNDVGETHTLQFDANGDLKIDGNAVGGGKQLYQVNIRMSNNSLFDGETYYPFSAIFTFICDQNIQSVSDFKTFLNGLTQTVICDGSIKIQNLSNDIIRTFGKATTNDKMKIYTYSLSGGGYSQATFDNITLEGGTIDTNIITRAL